MKKKPIPTLAEMEKEDEERRQRRDTCRKCGQSKNEHHEVLATDGFYILICDTSVFLEG